MTQDRLFSTQGRTDYLPERYVVLPLTQDEMLPAVSSIWIGGVIDWDSRETLTRDIVREAFSPRSQTTRLQSVLLVDDSSIRQDVINLTANYLEDQQSEINGFDFDSFVKVLHANFLARKTLHSAELLAKFDPDFEQSSNRFRKAYDNQRLYLLESLRRADLITFIKMCDANYALKAENEAYLERNGIPVLISPISAMPDYKQAVKESDDKKDEDFDAYEEVEVNAWNRLKAGWSWAQLNEAISLLPQIKSRVPLYNVVQEIYHNLHQSDYNGFLVGELPSAQSIYHLVKIDWSKWFKSDTSLFEDRQNLVTSNVVFGQYNIPAYHLPVVAVDYLLLAQKAGDGAFLQRLDEVSGEVLKDRDSQTKWLLALMSLRDANPPVQKVLNDFLDRSSLEEDKVRVLKDELPGKIWIGQNNKLRLTGTRTNLQNALLIYQSAAEEKIEEPRTETPIAKTNSEPKTPENQKEADAIFSYDFIGDVGIMPDGEAQKYLESLSSRIFLPLDELEVDFLTLMDSYRASRVDETVIFTADLNPGDKAMRNAKQIALDAVVISGPSVTFVLNKDAVHTVVDGKKLPLTLTGTLDETGRLVLDCQDEDADVDSPHLLYLNNIVLELIAKDTKPSEDQNIKEQLKTALTNWNQGGRGVLPRLAQITPGEDEVKIAVKINGQTTFVKQAKTR